jgi:hypothetical protein
MPRLSVYFIRASLIHLLLAFTLGGLMLANKGVTLSPLIWLWLPLHMEFALVGWMVQLAIGTAYWILPRFSKSTPRGPAWLLWSSFILLNAGILLAVGQSVFLLAAWLALGAKGLELAGIAAFVIGSWRRVKPMGA